MRPLEDFVIAFKSLGCAHMKGFTAPHKAIMLLTVIDEIENGYLVSANIPISSHMIEAFKKMWTKLVGNHAVFKPSFEMPFYHLSKEGFWKLKETPFYHKKDSYNLNQLRINFEHAELDPDLFNHLKQSDARDILKDVLLSKYISSKRVKDEVVNIAAEPMPAQPAKTTKDIANQASTNSSNLNPAKDKPMINFTPKFKTFFDRLLEQHGYEECPKPLWRLKLSDQEFESLRELLKGDASSNRGKIPFLGIPRECLLYIAEFWRREYVEGAHSKLMLFNTLGVPAYDDKLDYPNLLYKAAMNGAKQLKIEIYEGAHKEFLDSMLYQGGLPIQKIITPDTNSVWDRLADSIVRRNIDFDALEEMLGVIARNIGGIREFCNQLSDAVDSHQFLKMPFWCEDENDPRYRGLVERSKKVKREQRQRQPFSFEWEFDLHTIDGKMQVKYDIRAPQSLPSMFIEQHNLNNTPFFSVRVDCNSQPIDTFDFRDGFSRYEVRSKHVWHHDDVITVLIDGYNTSLLQQSLDTTTPQLLYQKDDGFWALGNRIGSRVSTILLPDGWTIENPQLYSIFEYNWDDKKFIGIRLSDNHLTDITLIGPDGQMVIGPSTTLFRTELMSSSLNVGGIKESVYDLSKCAFRLSYENDGSEKRIETLVKYRSKRSEEWLDVPGIGEIFAKAIHPNGEYVAPMRLINVGKGLIIAVKNEDSSSCEIKVSWPNGKVRPENATKLADDWWLVSRNGLQNEREIPIVFTPKDSPINAFTLHLRAPFKDFYILDENGVKVGSGAWIPYSDLDRYTYHLVGMDIKYYTDKKYRRLSWVDDNLSMVDAQQNRTKLPYEGQLSAILGSREEIRLMLDKTANNMLNASVKVLFQLPGAKKLEVEIKDSPYRILQSGNTLSITGKDYENIDYRRALLLFKLDEPEHKPETLYFDEELGYILPETVKDWGKIIATGRSRGRICPGLVEYDKDLDNETRIFNRNEAIKLISADIENGRMDDETWNRVVGWFKRTQEEDLPASSFLDLVCTAHKAESLLKLAFILYCQSDKEDRESLQNKLIIFSNDLAFQWWWLLPLIRKGVLSVLEPFICDPKTKTMLNLYVKWALGDPQTSGEKLKALNTDEYINHFLILFQNCAQEFTNWILSLCKFSLSEQYIHSESKISDMIIDTIINGLAPNKIERWWSDNHIDYNQKDLDDVKEFFTPYSDMSKSVNERWLLSRVNFMAQALKGKIDIFKMFDELDYDLADRVRRSLIFCYKSSRDEFLFALNEELYKN